MGGYLPVKVNIPLDMYRALNAEAVMARVTVADLIRSRITGGEPSKPPSPPKRGGYRGGYTTAAGETIQAGRRFGQTWPVIANDLGIGTGTAQSWLRKYEQEVREQNARDRAERKAS